ncbi:MAG: tetratricopeptide repeat protein [Alistipes sp.]|nr:tetratricopeptide repeat protein [Alistipes sp.]
MCRKITIFFTLSLLLCFKAVAGFSGQAAQLFNRAQTLLDQHRYADARYEFSRLRQMTDTSDVSAIQSVDYGLTVCAVHLDDNRSEQMMLDFLTRYAGSVYSGDIRFLLALYYCEQENFEAAKRQFGLVGYNTLTQADREQFDLRMGYIEFVNENYNSAVGYFDRISPLSDLADHATYYKSYIAYTEGNMDAAYKGFASLVNSDAYSNLVPFYLLQIEFERGNYQYVVKHCDALLEKSNGSETSAILRVASEAWFRLEGYNKAMGYITAYAKSFEGELSREDSYLLGYTSYRTANYAGAVEPLKIACNGTDELAQNASYHLADCYIRLGDKKNAISAFAMAANERYNNDIAEDALFNYGKLLFETGGGAFNESINVLTRYITRYPNTVRAPEAKELLIAAYYNSKDYDMAYNAIRSFPNPDGSLKTALQKITYFRGLEAFEVADYKLANESLLESQSVGVSPKYNALSAFWLGETAYQQGDMDKAVEHYNFYLKRAPRSAEEYKMALYNLGYAYTAQGNITAAQRALEGFMWLYKDRDSYRADGYNRLADVHYLQKNYNEAIKNYEGAMAIGTEQKHYATFRRAMSLGLLGKRSLKIDALRKIVSAQEGDYVDNATYELGRTYISAGSYSQSAEALESLIERHPSSPFITAALLDLGLIYFNLGDSDRALQSYDRVISAAPQSQAAKDAMQSVREIYVARGDVNSYFGYAERAGVECDLSVVTRDSLTYRAAEKIYLSGRTEQSISHFENYIANNPKGYYIDDALFCLSDSYLKCDSLDRALERMKLLSDRPKNRYTVSVLQKLADVTFEHKMFTESAMAYRRLYDAVEDSKTRISASRNYVEATILDQEDDLTLAMAEDVESLTDIEQSVLRKARFSKGEVLKKRGEEAEALEIFRGLSEHKSDEVGAHSSYYVILDHFNKGEHDKAEQLVYALADSKTSHSYYLGRAFIILGDIYAAKGDTFQARATYQSIIDGYSPADDGVVAEAQQKIQKL